MPSVASDGTGIPADCCAAVFVSCAGMPMPSVDSAATGIPAEVSVLEALQKNRKAQFKNLMYAYVTV